MVRHFIGISLFALILGGCYIFLSSDPLKSDSELIVEFNRYRSEYVSLVKLISEDKFVSSVHKDFVLVGDDWPTRWHDSSQPEFSTERWDDYQTVFSRLPDSKFQWVEKKTGVIVFSPTSSAFDDIDDSYESIYVGKGLAYSEVPLPTVASLDSMGFQYAPVQYRSIGSGWYIYRDSGYSKPE